MAEERSVNGVTFDTSALVASMTAPLQEHIAQLDKVIDDRTKELGALREERREAVRVLTRVAGAKPGPKPGASWSERRGRVLSQEERDTALAFVQALPTYDSEGFTISGADVAWRGNEPKMSQATWRNLVNDWHQTGVIRVLRKGRGGSIYYKVVGE